MVFIVIGLLSGAAPDRSEPLAPPGAPVSDRSATRPPRFRSHNHTHFIGQTPRQLPVHATTIVALRSYLTRRDRPIPIEPTDAMFTSAVGTRLTYCNVHLAFKRIVKHAGLVARAPVCRPRPHDLRHTFAVNTLLDAYRDDTGDGEQIQARIALLCTYLGHVNPGSTYWYLQAAPELLALVAERLERIEGTAR